MGVLNKKTSAFALSFAIGAGLATQAEAQDMGALAINIALTGAAFSTAALVVDNSDEINAVNQFIINPTDSTLDNAVKFGLEPQYKEYAMPCAQEAMSGHKDEPVTSPILKNFAECVTNGNMRDALQSSDKAVALKHGFDDVFASSIRSCKIQRNINPDKEAALTPNELKSVYECADAASDSSSAAIAVGSAFASLFVVCGIVAGRSKLRYG